MKRILLTIIISMVFLVPCFADDYVCMADLHPEQAKESGALRLGETAEIDEIKYRVIGECKNPDKNHWFQFVDVCEPGKTFDGECDYAVMCILHTDNTLGFTPPISCIKVLEMLKSYCQAKNIDITKFLHFVAPALKDCI